MPETNPLPENAGSPAPGPRSVSSVLLCVVLAGAVGFFLWFVDRHYAIGDWLFWRYLVVSALALAWAASCLAGGAALVQRLGVGRGGGLKDAVIAFPLGVFAFQLAIFLLGLLHLLNVVTFVALPLAFAFAGRATWMPLFRDVRALSPPRTLAQLGILLFGVAGIGLLYFQILSPEALHWDARWYHLPIAQHYARWGAVRAFPEGWWLGSYPHLASLIYTWAFLLPNSLLFDRIELCLHLELVVFIATLLSVPALVRAFVPQLRARGTWVAILLFPGVFLYESNLSGAADHIAALWCVPLVLTFMRVWQTWAMRDALMFGVFFAAGIDSKLSTWNMLILPGLLFLARGAMLIAGGARRRALGLSRGTAARVALYGLGAMLLFSAQHWLKNWIWYGDPVYPLLHKYFPDHPFNIESPAMLRQFYGITFPPRPGWLGVGDALAATVTFSFLPNDWPVYHRDVPVFGSLFTLSMLCLPFVRAPLRLWLGYLGAMLAIVGWYLTNHQDRYLQAWLPAMAACAMATLGLAWSRRERIVQVLIATLVLAQVVWGGDVPFFPTHNLVHDSPLHKSMELLASGFLRTPHRLRLFGNEGAAGELLPKDAVVLLHELNPQIGLDANTVSDEWQGRIGYAALGSPAAIAHELRALGITHIVWNAGLSGWNAVGADLLFLTMALNETSERHDVSGIEVATWNGTPAEGAAPPFNDRVAIMACGNPYPPGRYRVAKLLAPEPGQPFPPPEAPVGNVAEALASSEFFIYGGCGERPAPELLNAFHPPVMRGGAELYVRRHGL